MLRGRRRPRFLSPMDVLPVKSDATSSWSTEGIRKAWTYGCVGTLPRGAVNTPLATPWSPAKTLRYNNRINIDDLWRRPVGVELKSESVSLVF